MEEDEQKLQVRLVGRNGRRRFDPASKDRLVSACLEPGVSVSRLALDHGVNANLLRKWIKTRTETQSLPPSSPCQCRCKFPQKCRSKIPQLCRRGRHGEMAIFRRPSPRFRRRGEGGGYAASTPH
ncbi:transposase [Sinorhizobium meliloti]|uniref:transposase n=1 Tax=Rhizobium meliloti TaxID=382 RepID=UPI0013E32501